MSRISSVIDKSSNAYVFNMSGARPFEYTPSRCIKVFASGELLNKETSFIDFNKPVRVIFAHKGFTNQIPYIPFTLNASGSNGLSKIVPIYEPTGNNLGNVTWRSIGSNNNLNGPSFRIDNYGFLKDGSNFIIDRWFYSGNNFLNTTGSTFTKGSTYKNLSNSTNINNSSINLNQSGSTVGVSGVLLNNYSYDFGEIIVINKYLTRGEKELLSQYLFDKYNINPPGGGGGSDWGGGDDVDPNNSGGSSSSSSENGSSSSSNGGGGGENGGGNGGGNAGGGSASGDPIWKLFVRTIDLNSVQRNEEGQIVSVTTNVVQSEYLDTRSISLNLLSYVDSLGTPFNFGCSAGESCNKLPGVLLNIQINNVGSNKNDRLYIDDVLTCTSCYTPSVQGYQMLFKFKNLQNSAFPGSIGGDFNWALNNKESNLSSQDTYNGPQGLLVDFFSYAHDHINAAQTQDQNNTNLKKIQDYSYKIQFNPKINEVFKLENKNTNILNSFIPYDDKVRYTHNMLSLIGITSGPVNTTVPILDTDSENAKWELANNFTCLGCSVQDPVKWNPNYACGSYNDWPCRSCDPACPSSDETSCDSWANEEFICCDFNDGTDPVRTLENICECYDGSEADSPIGPSCESVDCENLDPQKVCCSINGGAYQYILKKVCTCFGGVEQDPCSCEFGDWEGDPSEYCIENEFEQIRYLESGGPACEEYELRTRQGTKDCDCEYGEWEGDPEDYCIGEEFGQVRYLISGDPECLPAETRGAVGSKDCGSGTVAPEGKDFINLLDNLNLSQQ
jgi:hypothetical protein